MGSLTKQLRRIRNTKKTKMGQKRKAKDRNQGSTPKFAIHEDKK